VPKERVEASRIEGVRPVMEAILAGRRRVLEVALPERTATRGLRELEALVRERGIARRAARPSEGVVATAGKYPEETAEALLEDPRPRFLVALDGVTDVGNLGSIARSAEAAGATGLLLEQRRAAPVDTGALRASAGALEHLRVGRTPNLGRALDLCGAEGLSILLADPEGEPLSRLGDDVLRGELAWVFGSEERGIRPGVRRRGGFRVGIRQVGRLRSLGVAAAAAYLLLRTLEVRARG
jgi:23S rRNA (guanosine2251-2'-O)-methyltransferase